MSERFPITKKGFIQLEEELHKLKTIERPAIIIAIAEARAHGDLSENAEYTSARDKQGFIEAKIADLESKHARAEIIDTTNSATDEIKFGAIVKLIDQDTSEEVCYSIVGDYEADLKNGYISVSSPLVKALLNKRSGDEVEVQTPKNIKYYKILSVKYE